MITRHVIHFRKGYLVIHTPQKEKVQEMKTELIEGAQKRMRRQNRQRMQGMGGRRGGLR